MRLVEQHIISKTNPHWQECDRLCFASKNLYNQALYRVLKEYEATKTYKSYGKLDKELSSENQVDYRRLPAKVSQQTLKLLDKNFKSYFKSLKAYKKNPDNFTGYPQPPHYKNKLKGRFATTFTIQAISKVELKDGIIKPSGSNIRIPTDKKVQQFRIIPIPTGAYKLEIVYLKDEVALIENERYAGIDIGLNNLATVVTNCEVRPFIINGKPLKAINQFYNKKLAELKSELPLLPKHILSETGNRIQKGKSKKTHKLTHKRNMKINDYMHKQSRMLVNILKQANISKVVIGKNKQWKQKINIGSQNNQKFVSIPQATFINMVIYKLKLDGITAICREESYTSKCSFLDNEPIKKQAKYLGTRIKRGLFRTATGKKWNADCNGAANILIKEIPNCFTNGIEAIVVSPVRIKSYKNAA